MRTICERSLIVLAFCLASAASMHASEGAFFQGIPGASCKPANIDQEDHYQYFDRALVNTGESKWDLVLAVCPISEVERSHAVSKILVLLRDDLEKDTWCDLYDEAGKHVDGENVEFSSGEGLSVLPPPPFADEGLLEGTIYCLLQPGASLERITVVWVDQ